MVTRALLLALLALGLFSATPGAAFAAEPAKTLDQVMADLRTSKEGAERVAAALRGALSNLSEEWDSTADHYNRALVAFAGVHEQLRTMLEMGRAPEDSEGFQWRLRDALDKQAAFTAHARAVQATLDDEGRSRGAGALKGALAGLDVPETLRALPDGTFEFTRFFVERSDAQTQRYIERLEALRWREFAELVAAD